MSTIKFFKHSVLINSLMLSSKPDGIDLLNKFTVALDRYFGSLIDNPNIKLKIIINAAQHGYTPAAAADYIIRWGYGEIIDEAGFNELSNAISETALSLMNYTDNHWGAQYNYRPSLEELLLDPIDVQHAINERVQQYSKTYGNGHAVYFGMYTNDTGALQRESELGVLKEYRDAVVNVIKQRRAEFLISA